MRTQEMKESLQAKSNLQRDNPRSKLPYKELHRTARIQKWFLQGVLWEFLYPPSYIEHIVFSFP